MGLEMVGSKILKRKIRQDDAVVDELLKFVFYFFIWWKMESEGTE